MSERLSAQTGIVFHLITEKEQLNYKYLRTLAPEIVFFTHWSFMIPREIYEEFTCVIFHMTDLPFGRGGSPLQNLIAKGFTQTKLSALQCVKELDAGPIFLKRDLSLYGNAEEIYLRASNLIEEMIIEILEQLPQPLPQEGEIVSFKRRKPKDGNLFGISSLAKRFDFIRMLDADGYPSAFIEHDGFRYEFSRASIKSNYLLADVKITPLKKDICDEDN